MDSMQWPNYDMKAETLLLHHVACNETQLGSCHDATEQLSLEDVAPAGIQAAL